MGRQEKIAWYNVGLFALVIIVFIILYYQIYTDIGDANERLFRSYFRSVSLFGLLALGPILFKVRTNGENKMDGVNPEKSIWKKPGTIGGIIAAIASIKIGKHYLMHHHLYYLIFIAIWLSAVCAFLYYLYKKSQEFSYIDTKNQNAFILFFYGPNLDERDIGFVRRAIRYGLTAFWIYYAGMFGGTVAWVLNQGIRTITIDAIIVVILLMMGPVILIFVESIAILILYRKDRYLAQE